MFNQFKTILCLCPNCDSLMRVSDLHIRSKSKVKETWLDEFERKQRQLEGKEEDFAREESEVRKKATDRGRTKVLDLVRKSMYSQFARLPYDPYDIKPLLHPIDFAVFDGMNKNEMHDVVLLSRKTNNPILQNHQTAISSVVKRKAYDWKVVRVSMDGQIEFE